MTEELEIKDFGACCSCGAEGENVNVRNVVMLEQKSTVPGSGWGCVQCGLSMEGAFAVICDDCLDLGRPIIYAVAGELKNKKRIPVTSRSAVSM